MGRKQIILLILKIFVFFKIIFFVVVQVDLFFCNDQCPNMEMLMDLTQEKLVLQITAIKIIKFSWVKKISQRHELTHTGTPKT